MKCVSAALTVLPKGTLAPLPDCEVMKVGGRREWPSFFSSNRSQAHDLFCRCVADLLGEIKQAMILICWSGSTVYVILMVQRC